MAKKTYNVEIDTNSEEFKKFCEERRALFYKKLAELNVREAQNNI